MIHHGDCIEVMAQMAENSVDAIVTDPPYGLEFMGKSWDSFATVKRQDEVTPTGQGHSTSAGPYLAHAVNRYETGRAAQDWHYQWAREAFRVAKPGAYLLAFGGTRTVHRLACAIEDAGWEIRDELIWVYASGFPKSLNLTGEREGWGTALKPAHEPIVMARKPLVGSVAANVTRYGTGAINISAARIGDNGNGRWPSNLLLSDPEIFDTANPYVVGSGAVAASGLMRPTDVRSERGGIYGDDAADGYTTVETYGDTGGYSRFFIVPKADRADREPVLRGQLEEVEKPNGNKWSDQDYRTEWSDGVVRKGGNRVRANVHPTVKPTDLMRHLVRLVTPSGGTVLDCFLGSGSTAIACEMEGFAWIGIEKEAEYVAIAEARLNGVQRGLGLDFGVTA